MANHALVIGWNRPVTGRENLAVELFNSVVSYLGKQQQAQTVESFEPVFLAAHGGDLNGFIIVRGDRVKLDKLAASDEWLDLFMKIQVNVEGFGIIPAWIGSEIATQMTRYQRAVK
jgi:hypothetical protein